MARKIETSKPNPIPDPPERTRPVRIWLTVDEMRTLTKKAIDCDPPKTLTEYILSLVISAK